jgi:cytochrome c peroxidase
MSLAGGRLRGTEPFHWDGRLKDMPELVLSTTSERMGGHGATSEIAADVLAFLDSLPVPVNPKHGPQLTEAQARGEAVYKRAECGTCHSGAALTNNSYAHVGTDEESPGRFPGSTTLVIAFPNGGPNVPSLLGLARTAPYLHDGTAATLHERIMEGKSADQHGKTSNLSEQDVLDLVDYLETL